MEHGPLSTTTILSPLTTTRAKSKTMMDWMVRKKRRALRRGGGRSEQEVKREGSWKIEKRKRGSGRGNNGLLSDHFHGSRPIALKVEFL